MAKFQLEGILKLVDVQISPVVFQKISRAVAGMPQNINLSVTALHKATSQANKLSNSTKNVASNISTMSRAAQLFLQRMAQFAVLLPTFATLNHAIQGGVKFLGDFEDKLINIVRVDIAKIAPRFNEIAAAALNIGMEFGASAVEVASSIQIFVQAGEEVEKALENAAAATLASKVTTLDLAAAQEVLIASSQIFKKESLSAMETLDKLAVVEDIAAVNAQDIADAWRTGGNALAFATKSIDDTNALIAALGQQTRKSGREVGTFFKTLSTRILAAGESKSAVEALGVQVEDLATGNLRPLLSILTDLKVKFDGLTEAEQASAAKAIAGVRQFESFLATLQSLGNAQRFAAESADAAGTLLQKEAVNSEKLTVQIDKMIAAFQGLAASLGDAGLLDFFKDAVGAAKLFANALSVAVGFADKLNISLLPLLGIGAIKLGGAIFSRPGSAASTGGKSGGPGGVFGTPGANNFVSTSNKAASGLQKSFAISIAAALAVGTAFEAVSNTIRNSNSIYSKSTADIVSSLGSAANTGIQFGLAFGKSAGMIAAATSIVVDAISKISEASEESARGIRDLADIGKREAKFAAATGAIATSPELATNIIDALSSAFKGKAPSEFNKAFAEAFKEIATLPGLDKLKLGAGDVRELFLANKDLLNILAEQKNKLDASNPENQKYIDLLDKLSTTLSDARNAGEAFKNLGEESAKFANAARSSIDVVSELTDTFEGLKKIRDIKDTFSEIGLLGFEIKKLALSPEDIVDGFAALRIEAAAAKQSLENATTGFGQLISTLRGQAIGLGISPDNMGKMINRLFELTDKAIATGGKSVEDTVNELFKEFQLFGEPAQAALKEFAEQMLTFKTATLEANSATKAIDIEIFRRTTEATKALEEAQQKYNEVIGEGQIATLKFGAVLDKDVLRKLSALSFEEFQKILSGLSDAPKILQDAVKAIAGTDAEKGASKQEAAVGEAAIKVSLLNDQLRKLSIESNKANQIKDEELKKIKQTEIAAKVQEVQTEITKARQEALVKTAEARIEKLQGEQKALEDAAKAEDQRIKALEKLRDAEEDLNKTLRKTSEGFRQFIEASRADLLEREADAQQSLKDAQQDVISSTDNVAESFKDFKASIIAFNDAMAEAEIEANLLGRDIAILTGGISTFQGRLSSLDTSFRDVLKDANISLQQRIDLERQLAEETLSFLQQAQAEIVGAGLEVFGQSPEENRALQEGIGGLETIAQKLGGSFEQFLNLTEGQINSISRDLLSLPLDLRKKILDALGTLPSTVNIGGFSVEQLEQAIGQIGAGVAPGAGLPSIEELTDLQAQQLEKLQDLAIRDAELQISQVFAAHEQLAIAEAQLEASKVQADRAKEDLGAVRDSVIEQNTLLLDAQALQQSLTQQVIAAQDNNTLQQIIKQSELFGESNQNAREIKDEIVSAITRLAEAQERRIEAGNALRSGFAGHIPNFAGGNISPREAAGVLKAASREKRAMPAGAQLAVANTSEAIIPMKYSGHIPNFQEGSAIAAGIETIKNINETVVAAIARSVVQALSDLRENGSDNTDELNTIIDRLETLNQGISDLNVINTTISENIAIQAASAGSAGASTSVAAAPVDITLNTNQQNNVNVTGLDNLVSEIENAINKGAEEQIRQQLTPIIESIQAVVQVLRERNIISSFGQPG